MIDRRNFDTSTSRGACTRFHPPGRHTGHRSQVAPCHQASLLEPQRCPHSEQQASPEEQDKNEQLSH
eukprot:scaffold2619_cov218-Ochromonas_danica.AAC.2